MIENNKIGERMKSRREEIGVSVLDIAEQTGLSKATIHRYESGEIKKIKLPVIGTIANILKVNPDWLIGKSENKLRVVTTEYVETKDRRDIKKVLYGLSEYITAKNNLLYDNKPLTPEVRLMLLANIDAIIKIIDKLYIDNE